MDVDTGRRRKQTTPSSASDDMGSTPSTDLSPIGDFIVSDYSDDGVGDLRQDDDVPADDQQSEGLVGQEEDLRNDDPDIESS
jgi:hypothetical protein